MKKRLGRPPLPGGDVKTYLVGIRFTPDQADFIAMRAAGKDKTVVDYIRDLVLTDLSKNEILAMRRLESGEFRCFSSRDACSIPQPKGRLSHETN